MTLLAIVKDAAVRCGFNKIPISAVGNADSDVQQLVAFAQDSGQELLERANWVNLDTAGSLFGDGVATLFQLPGDWIRFSPSDKCPRGALVSNKFPLFPLFGPINTEDLNLLKTLPASTTRPVWRVIGGALEIWPALAGPPVPNPDALPGEKVTFNYYSAFWVSNAARTITRDFWQADDDFSLLPEGLILKGTVWRWKASKGLEYAEDFRIYETSFPRNAGQQQTGRVVDTSRKYALSSSTHYGSITAPG